MAMLKKIYIAHSTYFDFKKELYEPMKKLKGFELILPHEKSKTKNSKETIKKCAAVIAEVSHPSHGVGIELGWADGYGIPIILIFRKGHEVSPSLRIISDKCLEYTRIEDILPLLAEILGGA